MANQVYQVLNDPVGAALGAVGDGIADSLGDVMGSVIGSSGSSVKLSDGAIFSK